MATQPKQVKTNARNIDIFSTGTYKSFKLSDVATRPNSLGILAKPSKYGSNLHHPDGTITKGDA